MNTALDPKIKKKSMIFRYFLMHLLPQLSSLDLREFHRVKWPWVALVLYWCRLIDWILFNVPLENFSLIWRRHRTWRASNFDLYSALRAIEQWGFFIVPTPAADTGPWFLRSHLKDPQLSLQSAIQSRPRYELTTWRSRSERSTDWATVNGWPICIADF